METSMKPFLKDYWRFNVWRKPPPGRDWEGFQASFSCSQGSLGRAAEHAAVLPRAFSSLEEKNPEETEVSADPELKASDGRLDINEDATSPSKISGTLLQGNINSVGSVYLLFAQYNKI